MSRFLERPDDLDGLNGILKFIQDRIFPENIGVFDYESHGTPDTEKALAHNLERIPSYYVVLSQDKAGSLYLGGTAWTSSNVYFKCNVATVTLKVLLF